MSTLLLAARGPIPPDEAEVRSTVTVVKDDAPAMQEDAPDFNEFESDPDTHGGLTTRELSSNVTPSEQYRPLITNANDDLFAPVNSRISTAGTAAAREAAGEWGSGTMTVVQGIEPALSDGTRLGADYFAAAKRSASDTEQYMTPSEPTDPYTSAAAQASAEAASRRATQVSMYDAFYRTIQGGVL